MTTQRIPSSLCRDGRFTLPQPFRKERIIDLIGILSMVTIWNGRSCLWREIGDHCAHAIEHTCRLLQLGMPGSSGFAKLGFIPEMLLGPNINAPPLLSTPKLLPVELYATVE